MLKSPTRPQHGTYRVEVVLNHRVGFVVTTVLGSWWARRERVKIQGKSRDKKIIKNKKRFMGHQAIIENYLPQNFRILRVYTCTLESCYACLGTSPISGAMLPMSLV